MESTCIDLLVMLDISMRDIVRFLAGSRGDIWIQPRLAHSGPCILELHQVTSAMKYKNHMGFESDVPAGNDTRCDGCLVKMILYIYHSSFIII